MSNTSLTPPTIDGEVYPSAPSHFGDLPVRPLVDSIAPDGITYRVTWGHLLGPWKLFLTSTRTPAQRDSWTRPLLIDHNIRDVDRPRDVTLKWQGARTATLSYRKIDGSRVDVHLSLAALRRDSDHDGWTDIEERWLGLDPRRPDTDGDGIPDGRDTCPMPSKPAQTDDLASAIQRVFVVPRPTRTGVCCPDQTIRC